ncbi:Sugar phosphate permease [Dethiosulfatibacter aminovorans DSM 17477]|uniref:Sugar phosphate permease n=1 Tax=Dethiosulfatibacter aminovorans DSM 17477 TaxID=1121476 RepID=A0A1M6BNF9_9FIRM|nr:MFS transporter [Dethiosulfatibacter aminovorans]SHI50108.1 Sugar phosphate permease [Dethiosulfatibacter aminovorans DSM 17477]
MNQTDHSSKKNSYKQLVAVSVGHFTNDFFAGLIAPISLYFALKLDLNLTQQGILSIVMLVFASFFQPFFGLLSDKKGKPGHLIISIIWISVWISVSGIVNNFYLLVVVLALGSSASALFHTLGSTTAVSLGGTSKGTSLSVFMTVGGFSATVSSIVGLWIATTYGIEKIAFLMIPGCAAAACMYFLGIQNVKIDTEENQKNGKLAAKEHKKEKLNMSGRDMAWLVVLIYVSLIKVLSGRFIVTYGIQILTIKNFAYGAVLLTIHLFGRPVGTMVGGMLIDKIGDKRVFIIGMLASLVSLSMIGYGGSILAAIGVGSLGFSISFTNTVGVLMSHKIIPNSQSFATGIIMGIPGGIGSISMMIFSGIADVNGLIYSTRVMMIPLFIATVLTYFMVYRRKKA